MSECLDNQYYDEYREHLEDSLERLKYLYDDVDSNTDVDELKLYEVEVMLLEAISRTYDKLIWIRDIEGS